MNECLLAGGLLYDGTGELLVLANSNSGTSIVLK